jgi:hypothetical protein
MITAPVAIGIEVSVPKTRRQRNHRRALVITIDRASVYLGNEPVNIHRSAPSQAESPDPESQASALG